MKKYLLLLLLLLPSLAWAGTFKVHKAEKIEQPAGTIDRVSKRTAHGKVFEYDHIGSGRFVSVISAEPIHYLDSTGTYQEFKFDTAQDTVSGFQVVRTGKFDVAYDSTGRIRWQKKDALLTISPAFSRTNVDIDFNINRNGLKANYILKNASAPNVLKWLITANDTVEEQVGGKGKGQLKKASKVMGNIAEFTARDAAGKVVNLSASYKKDSLIVTLDTAGAVFPVIVDPTVNDSAKATSGARLGVGGSTWLVSRDTTRGYTVEPNHPEYVHPWTYDTGTKATYRRALTFPMASLTVPSTVDSVRFWMKTDGTRPAVDTTIIYIAAGKFSGATPDTSWFNKFVGRTIGSAHIGPWMDSTHIGFYAADAAVWKSDLFTKAGRDTLKTHMGVDSLRLMVLEKSDVIRSIAAGGDHGVADENGNAPYLQIYYTINPPGVTTTANADSLKPAVVMYAVIDSIGGANATVRGFKLWPKGGTLAGDTINVSQTGSYGTGAFYIYVDSLKVDTLYRYKGYATNTGGTSYGALDSFRTNLGGTSFYVDGRLVTGIH